SFSLDDPAKGSLSSLGGFTHSGGLYTLSATPAAVTSALRAVVFTPATGRLEPEESEAITFSLTVDDNYEAVTRTVSLTVTAPAAPASGCDGSPDVGTVCDDGAVYVGLSNGTPIFAAASDSTEIGWGG